MSRSGTAVSCPCVCFFPLPGSDHRLGPVSDCRIPQNGGGSHLNALQTWIGQSAWHTLGCRLRRCPAPVQRPSGRALELCMSAMPSLKGLLQTSLDNATNLCYFWCCFSCYCWYYFWSFRLRLLLLLLLLLPFRVPLLAPAAIAVRVAIKPRRQLTIMSTSASC